MAPHCPPGPPHGFCSSPVATWRAEAAVEVRDEVIRSKDAEIARLRSMLSMPRTRICAVDAEIAEIEAEIAHLRSMQVTLATL
jgi:hypothetical protein